MPISPSAPAHPADLQVALDRVELGLRAVHQDDPARSQAVDLADELRADGSARAGDQHGAVADQLLHGGRVLAGQRPAEQVLHPHLSRAERIEAAVGELVERRDRSHLEPGRQPRVHHPADRRAVGAGHRDQQALGIRRGDGRRKLLEPAEDVDAVDLLAVARGIVVEEADGPDPRLRVTEGGPGDDHARLPGAVQQRRDPVEPALVRDPA
jgi:hypothetical protein